MKRVAALRAALRAALPGRRHTVLQPNGGFVDREGARWRDAR